ncbi:unnamed protein product, partial [Mesorhabditis spiculigera]
MNCRNLTKSCSPTYRCILYNILILGSFLRLCWIYRYEQLKIELEIQRLEQRYHDFRKLGAKIDDVRAELMDNGGTKAIVKPFTTMYPEYLVSTRHRLSICLIPKNMSTLMTRIFCLLNRSLEKGMQNRKLTESMERDCALPIRYSTLVQVQARISGDTARQNLILTREPMERFLSAFLMLCIVRLDDCFGCYKNMECVSEMLLIHSQRYASGDHTVEGNALWHMAPQNWHCNLQGATQEYEYLDYSPLQGRKFSEKLKVHLEKANVENSTVSKIIEDMGNNFTGHQTILEPQRNYYAEKLLNSKKIRRNLLYVYFYDYVLFGYEFPDVY